MPAELENATIMFTDEAEVALKKEMARIERRIRGRAIDEAVRSRGVPAEVTGSDIARASRTFMYRMYRNDFRSSASGRISESRGIRDFVTSEASRHRDRVRTISDLLPNFYIWLGLLTTIIGLLYPPIYYRYRILAQDRIWRSGLFIGATGLAIFFLGVL